MNTDASKDDAIHVQKPQVATADRSTPPDAGHPSVAAGSSQRKKAILAGLGLVALAAACYYGIPMLILAFTTVSTDDAYVNSHVTFVAARVSGQVEAVLVDDNYPVTKGMPIVRLDKVPFQKEVDRKEADLKKALADRVDAEAKVNTMVAQARNARFKLEFAMDNLNAQVAQLGGIVASLNGDLARRKNAREEFDRQKKLAETKGATTPQEFDSKQRDYLVAKAKVEQTLQSIVQIRTSFGLKTESVEGDKITTAAEWLAKTREELDTTAPEWFAHTPPDLDQKAPAIRQAVAELMQAAAPLGVSSSSFDLTPKNVLQEFLKRDPEPQKGEKGQLDRIYKDIIKKAPLIEQADAKIAQAKSDLAVAKLNLDYCVIYAEIDGVVTRRNVNEGNNVQAGQSLMAIRSLTEIWIDANFKETQLADLRIGQPVKIEVDMYGSRQEFDGRITGFTMGTGQTLALLPPQNATGNFVKIVQRLPVKIELFDYDPEKAPLFVGLSVTPYVYYGKDLVGKDKDRGKYLQTLPRGKK
jgi:membrane fusion protein, multidrug efflux system